MTRARTNRHWIVVDTAYVDVSTPKHPWAVAIIDAEKIGMIADGGNRWFATSFAGTVYAGRMSRNDRGDRAICLMHRHVSGLSDSGGPTVDHRDGDGLNNTHMNLRKCTQAQNICNQAKRVDNVSGFKGVSWNASSSKWRATLGAGGRQVHLGVFADKREAAIAYDTGAKVHHGAFARLNFPGGL